MPKQEFMGAFTAFVKPFEVQQGNVKMKIYLNFHPLLEIETVRSKMNSMIPFCFWLNQ